MVSTSTTLSLALGSSPPTTLTGTSCLAKKNKNKRRLVVMPVNDIEHHRSSRFVSPVLRFDGDNNERKSALTEESHRLGPALYVRGLSTKLGWQIKQHFVQKKKTRGNSGASCIDMSSMDAGKTRNPSENYLHAENMSLLLWQVGAVTEGQ